VGVAGRAGVVIVEGRRSTRRSDMASPDAYAPNPFCESTVMDTMYRRLSSDFAATRTRENLAEAGDLSRSLTADRAVHIASPSGE